MSASLATTQRSSSPSREDVSRYHVVVLDTVVALNEHVAAWEDLARNAIESNIFFEPWFLLPALNAFSNQKDCCFVLIYDSPTAQRRQPLLCGFFPLLRRRLHRFLPVTIYEIWNHLYGFLATPLLRQGVAAAILERFFAWMQADRRGASLLRLELVSGDGPFGQALTDLVYHRQSLTYVVESYCRACLEPTEPAESYLLGNLHRKRLKEFSRKQQQLEALGDYQQRVLVNQDDIDAWAEMFLALEAGGWKGKEGTAIGCRPSHAAFFREVLHGAFQRGQLMMIGLFLDNKPIAMKCNFLGRSNEWAPAPGSFAFKIAFDEAYAVYSPGVLLEIANIDLLHAGNLVRWMDSCAVPDHFMINRLWRQRRTIQTVFVSSGRWLGEFLVSLMPLGRWFKRLFRRPQPKSNLVSHE